MFIQRQSGDFNEENFCAYLWSKKQWSFGTVHGTIANVVPLGTWTKVKGAAERGYDLSAARWGTLRWFSRCQWSPEGTLHLLLFPWQTFQLHLLHKGWSATAVWRLAYKTGPLLYKLKKPPRTPPKWEDSSTVRYNNIIKEPASVDHTTPADSCFHLTAFSSSATTCSAHFVALA